MSTKKIIEDLNKRGAEYVVYTNIAYGRGINGIGYDSYCMSEEFGGENNPKTICTRTFEPKEDHLVITERFVPPVIPWKGNKAEPPYTRRRYIGYDNITYIKEIVD